MMTLSDKELFQALNFARQQDQDSGRRILEHFQLTQTALAQTLFQIFPVVIAESDQALSQLFMDLCSAVIGNHITGFAAMNLVTEIKPESMGLALRVKMVCNARMICAATGTGSRPKCGRAA